MNLTKQQIKALIDEKGNARNCPECELGIITSHSEPTKSCKLCQGTGKATIAISKEWVEREVLGVETQDGQFPHRTKIKIPKYEVNEEIYYCLVCNKEVNEYHKRNSGDAIKLKIISETETTHTLVMSPR